MGGVGGLGAGLGGVGGGRGAARRAKGRAGGSSLACGWSVWVLIGEVGCAALALVLGVAVARRGLGLGFMCVLGRLGGRLGGLGW